MRIDFNVLWVDDQPEYIKSKIDAITRKMKKEGFLFKSRLCKSVDDVTAAIGDDIFTDEIDLILVDWDLGTKFKGQDAIVKIRESVKYRDVVFYSAQTTPNDLRKRASEKGLEGIYCTSRDNLVDDVMGVFESLVKKVLDLDHTRGIVMGATSDIDQIVNECLLVLFENADVAGKDRLLKKACKYVEEQVKEASKRAERVIIATHVKEQIAEHMILTSDKRLSMLIGTLKGETLKVHKDKAVDYQKNVVHERNILAHAGMKKIGENRVLVDSEGNTVTLEKTRELRCKILESRDEFSSLLDLLSGGEVAAQLPGPDAGAAQ